MIQCLEFLKNKTFAILDRYCLCPCVHASMNDPYLIHKHVSHQSQCKSMILCDSALFHRVSAELLTVDDVT